MGVSLVGRNGKYYGLPASLWVALIRIAERDLGRKLQGKSRYSREECKAIGGVIRKAGKKLPPAGGRDALNDPSFFNEFADFLESCGGLTEED